MNSLASSRRVDTDLPRPKIIPSSMSVLGVHATAPFTWKNKKVCGKPRPPTCVRPINIGLIRCLLFFRLIVPTADCFIDTGMSACAVAQDPFHLRTCCRGRPNIFSLGFYVPMFVLTFAGLRFSSSGILCAPILHSCFLHFPLRECLRFLSFFSGTCIT